MLLENSIQARFGGDCLPTAIEKLNISRTDFSNQIVVQINPRNIMTRKVLNLSVIEFPIFLGSDSSIHQTFDLTHERRFERDLRGRGSGLSPPLRCTQYRAFQGVWGNRCATKISGRCGLDI